MMGTTRSTAVQSLVEIEQRARKYGVLFFVFFYAALLPRRGRILLRTLSVRLSVRPVIVAIGNVFSSTVSVTDVLFGTH